MPFTDQFSTVPSASLQSISLGFGAASLAQSAGKPPVKVSIYPVGAVGLGDVVSVDATITEVHTANTELTSHPVETGANITDHARQNPREVQIDGFITNSPIDGSILDAALRAVPALYATASTGPTAGALSSAAVLGTMALANALSGSDITRDNFDRFQRFWTNSTLLQVFTPFRVYTNMIMVNFKAPREQANGDALKFSATFREVFFVASQLVTIPVATVAQSVNDMGTQSPTPSPASLTNSKDTVLNQYMGKALNKIGLTLPARGQ